MVRVKAKSERWGFISPSYSNDVEVQLTICPEPDEIHRIYVREGFISTETVPSSAVRNLRGREKTYYKATLLWRGKTIDYTVRVREVGWGPRRGNIVFKPEVEINAPEIQSSEEIHHPILFPEDLKVCRFELHNHSFIDTKGSKYEELDVDVDPHVDGSMIRARFRESQLKGRERLPCEQHLIRFEAAMEAVGVNQFRKRLRDALT